MNIKWQNIRKLFKDWEYSIQPNQTIEHMVRSNVETLLKSATARIEGYCVTIYMHGGPPGSDWMDYTFEPIMADIDLETLIEELSDDPTCTPPDVLQGLIAALEKKLKRVEGYDR